MAVLRPILFPRVAYPRNLDNLGVKLTWDAGGVANGLEKVELGILTDLTFKHQVSLFVLYFNSGILSQWKALHRLEYMLDHGISSFSTNEFSNELAVADFSSFSFAPLLLRPYLKPCLLISQNLIISLSIVTELPHDANIRLQVSLIQGWFGKARKLCQSHVLFQTQQWVESLSSQAQKLLPNKQPGNPWTRGR